MQPLRIAGHCIIPVRHYPHREEQDEPPEELTDVITDLASPSD